MHGRIVPLLRATAILIAAGALAACGASPGGNGNSSSSTSGSAAVTKGIPANEHITLSVWDYAQEDNSLQRVMKAFEKAHPNVKVKLNMSKGFDDYYSTIKLGLSGPDAPDLVTGNTGWTTDGPLVKANLIVPLDKYAKAYGWNSRFGNLDEFKFTSDGKQWGTGKLYGISHWAGDYGIFVHTKKLQEMGLKIPTNITELEHAMAVAKQHGEIPMMYGGLDKWPAPQELGMIMNMISPPQKVNDWIYGRNNTKFADLKAVKAASILQDWSKKGYFTPQFNGVSYQDATTNFSKGKGLFMFTGTWIVPTFAGKDVAFFTLPKDVAMGGYGEGWHITSASKHKDAAAALLDFMTSKPAELTYYKVGGFIPAMPLNLPGVKAKPLFAQAQESWNNVAEDGTVLKLLEWATPEMGQTIDGDIQKLMVGRMTPQALVEDVEATHAKFQQSQK